MASIIGMEIGNDSIKLAICSGGKAKKLIYERLPDNMVRDGRIAIPEAMSEFLSGLKKKHKIQISNVALVFPASAVITRTLLMPAMSDAQLRLNLPYEFRDYIGEDNEKTDFQYDYAVLPKKEEVKEEPAVEDKDKAPAPAADNKPEDIEIFAAAIKKSTVEEYYTILKKAGFKLVAGIPAEMAMANIIAHGQNVPEEVCFVDVGHVKTNVSIYKNGNFQMGKTIEVGGQVIDAGIAMTDKVDEHVARTYKETNLEGCQSLDTCIDTYNRITMEVVKIVNFYTYSTHSEGLKDIYFFGGSSLLETLRTKIVKGTELNPHDMSKLVNGADELDEGVLYCALAIGAGIQK